MTRPAISRAKVTSTTNGTGSFVLGAAVSGEHVQGFLSSLNGHLVTYAIDHMTEGNGEWETGIGTYTHATTTLTREFVDGSSTGAKVSFSAGTKHVRITDIASISVPQFNTIDPVATNDISEGYVAFRSFWVNTTSDTWWICVDHTDGVAVWNQIATTDDIGELSLADGSVTTAKLADSAVTAGKLASNAVTGLKILDAAVTTGKVADGALTEPKLASGAVTTIKIADAAVTAEKLAPGAIDGAVLGDDSVNTINIVDGAVTLPKLEEVTSGVVLGRFSVDVGTVEAFDVANLAEEPTPAAGDFLLGWTGNSLRKFDIGELPGGAGGGISAVDYDNVIDVDTGTTLGTAHLNLQASGANLNKVLLRARHSTNQATAVTITLPDAAGEGWTFDLVVAGDQTGVVTLIPQTDASTINGVNNTGGGIPLGPAGSVATLFVAQATGTAATALLKGETDEARSIRGLVTFLDGFALSGGSDTANFGGLQAFGNLAKVEADGTLAATQSGQVIVTNANVIIPTTSGFNCTLIAGGAHTVTFNSTTSAAMAAGDMMSLVVESATVIHAVLTSAADKVSFI